MSALAAATVSSAALGQTVSSGTTPSAAPVSAPVSSAAAVIPSPWVIGEIRAEGLKNVRMSVIRGQIKARKGSLYDRPDLDRDVQALLGLGEFDRVGADILPLDKAVPDQYRKVAGGDKEVALVFRITERPVIRKIVFEGQKGLSRGTLTDAMTSKVSDPYDRFKLDEDVQKLVDKYHEKGYLDAAVSFQAEEDTAALKTDVVFHIQEGPKSRIALVEIAGIRAFKPKKILKLMKNRRKKVYVEKDLPEDLRKIESYYKNNGYLDVRLSTPLVTLSPDKTRIRIALGVDEGRSYRFGETRIDGYLVLASSSLYKAVEYRPGRLFNQEKLDDSIRNIQEQYADVGRLRTRITPVKTFNPATDRMDVLLRISEGSVSYVDHVDVDGNRATKTYVLRREIIVKPGERFSAARVRKSRERMMNLGFLDAVDVDLQPSPVDPDKVDLDFDVTEGKPGSLTAGAAYSSLDGLLGTLSIQHLNVLGRAQRVALQWSFGKRVQDYSLSWTTPWVDGHPTSLGADLFHTRRINPYQGDLSAYTEHRTGGSLRLGPRFADDKYQLNLSYTLAKIGIDGIDPNVDFGGTLSEGTSVQSVVGVEFARDTRDSIWDPTEGTRNGIGAELSGGPLQGNINFFKPSITDQTHWTIYRTPEDWPCVLSLYHRAGYVTPFGSTPVVPVQDRYYVGGQDSLRGYPPDGSAGFPDGGYLYDVANVEIGFPLARERRKTIVKLVTFFDAGNAWGTPHDISGRIGSQTRDIKTDVGLGLRFVTPAFPIRLDYGYGFNNAAGRKNYQINFGLGPLF